jgi:hypothetical protein
MALMPAQRVKQLLYTLHISSDMAIDAVALGAITAIDQATLRPILLGLEASSEITSVVNESGTFWKSDAEWVKVHGTKFANGSRKK